MTYTSSEVREFLRISQSALSRYCRIFHGYLSYNPPGKHRRYTQSDITTLSKIRTIARQSKFSDVYSHISRPDNPMEKSEEDVSTPLSLQESFIVLADQVKVLGNMLEQQAVANRQLQEADRYRTKKVREIVELFGEVVKDLDKQITFCSMYSNYQQQIDRLRERVVDLENKKFSIF